MGELDRYLDLYRVGDAVQRSVSASRPGPMWVGPETGFFNAPFPELRAGLDGLRAVGDPLPRPAAATLPDGYVAPTPAWLQRALNSLSVLGGGQPILTVDGAAGARTLAATLTVWNSFGARGSSRAPYLVTVDGARTIAMKRDLLQWIVDKHLVEVAGPATVAPDTSSPPLPELPPPATGSGSGGLLVVAAAIAAGAYFMR